MKIGPVDDYLNEATSDVATNLYLNSILLCGKNISHNHDMALLLFRHSGQRQFGLF